MTDDSPSQPAKPKALLITLISVGGALLIAIIVLLVVLLTSGGSRAADTLPTPSSSEVSLSPTPSPSEADAESPTPEPSPTETEEEAEPAPPPPPPSNDPKINSFTINNSSHPVVYCNTAVDSHQYLLVKWSSSNVDQVYFGVATNDASTAALFENLPPSGNSSDDFEDGYNNGNYEFPCPTGSQKYTLTVVGDGKKVSKSVTVTNDGDQ